MTDFYLFRAALRDLLLPRKILPGILLALLPPLIGLLWRFGAREDFSAELAYNLLSASLIFGFVLVILSVVFSTGVIAQDIEQKTIMYLLTRPVPRWRILLTKFAAAALVTTGAAWLSCVLLAVVVFGTSLFSPSPRLTTAQIKDAKTLVAQLKDSPEPVSFYLQGELSESVKSRIDSYDENKRPKRRLLADLTADLNRILEKGPLYEKERFADVKISPPTQRLLAQNPADRAGLYALNRALLEDAYPDIFSRSESPFPRVGRDLLMLPVGALAYGSVFLLLATLVQRPLIFGLLFAFGWETWVPSLPNDFQRVSIMSYLRVLAPHRMPDSGSEGANAALAIFNPATISMPFAWGAALGLIVVALFASLVAFSTREYTPRDDA